VGPRVNSCVEIKFTARSRDLHAIDATQVNWLKTTQAVASALLVPTTVPLIMVFGVTGLIIFFNVHLDRLLHGLDGGKDKYYALYALTQCLSSAAMWAEPYLCDSLLVKYGGHVVFDYSIPLAFIVYLAAASRMEPRKAKAA
jgi:hypothetical protein